MKNVMIICLLAFMHCVHSDTDTNEEQAVQGASALEPVVLTPVEINSASAEEIARKLPGIGLKKAMAIVHYRDQEGGIHSIEELRQVKGIGKILAARVEDSIVFD